MGGAELEDLQNLGSPYIDGAYALSERTFVVWLRMSGEAVYRLEVGTAGFWRHPSRVPDDVDLSNDERSAYFSGFADVTLHFGARFDAEGDELTSVELIQMTSA